MFAVASVPPLDGGDTLPPVPAGREAPAETYHLPVDRLYAEMVPFGPAFQNVVSPVQLGPEGARAVVSGGATAGDDRLVQLGSPFPLDAAFHAACAWSQRFQASSLFRWQWNSAGSGTGRNPGSTTMRTSVFVGKRGDGSSSIFGCMTGRDGFANTSGGSPCAMSAAGGCSRPAGSAAAEANAPLLLTDRIAMRYGFGGFFTAFLPFFLFSEGALK